MVHVAHRIKASEDLAADCQNYLRVGINRILQAQDALRDEFCKYTKKHDRKNTFYNAFISFGDFQEAINYWQTLTG